MEDSLKYSAEEPELPSASQWQIHEDTYMLAERESSKEFLQYKSYHLHLKRKRELPAEWKNYPTTYWDRLAFYRSYFNSPIKMQIMSLYHVDFNERIWYKVLLIFMLQIPHVYVHIFLASYVPETHLFLAKMVPIMQVKYFLGTTIALICGALLEFLSYFSTIMNILDFLVNAIFSKNPWNQCPKTGYFIGLNNDKQLDKIYCYHITNIAKRIENSTVLFRKNYYRVKDEDEIFQFGQVYYYLVRQEEMSILMLIMYGLIIFSILVMCYEKTYGRFLWRVLQVFHNAHCGMFLINYVYLLLRTNDEVVIPEIDMEMGGSTKSFPKMAYNFFALSSIAPPVYHILEARTANADRIQPGRVSAAIILSHSAFEVIIILQTVRAVSYMQELSQLPLYMPGVSHMNTQFIYYTLYFSIFYFGDVFSMLFFLLFFMTEMVCCIIHLELTLELMKNQWKRLLKRRTYLVVTFTGMILCVTSRYYQMTWTVPMFYSKMMLSLMEVIIIYCMYPIFRLIDDMSFHLGRAVHICRIYLMMVVPFYYAFKTYTALKVSFQDMWTTDWAVTMKRGMIVAYPCTGLPVVAGICYAYYKYVLKARRNWRRLFAPTEDWGPKDYVVRQLRKDYDSRTYTKSEVSRRLSRHIFSKTAAKAYELDICYNSTRRSTQIE